MSIRTDAGGFQNSVSSENGDGDGEAEFADWTV
jgi:hypothetical protein